MSNTKIRLNSNFEQKLPALSGKTSFSQSCRWFPSLATSRILDSVCFRALALKNHETKSSIIWQNLGHWLLRPEGNWSRTPGSFSIISLICLSSSSSKFSRVKGNAWFKIHVLIRVKNCFVKIGLTYQHQRIVFQCLDAQSGTRFVCCCSNAHVCYACNVIVNAESWFSKINIQKTVSEPIDPKKSDTIGIEL